MIRLSDILEKVRLGLRGSVVLLALVYTCWSQSPTNTRTSGASAKIKTKAAQDRIGEALVEAAWRFPSDNKNHKLRRTLFLERFNNVPAECKTSAKACRNHAVTYLKGEWASKWRTRASYVSGEAWLGKPATRSESAIRNLHSYFADAMTLEVKLYVSAQRLKVPVDEVRPRMDLDLIAEQIRELQASINRDPQDALRIEEKLLKLLTVPHGKETVLEAVSLLSRVKSTQAEYRCYQHVLLDRTNDGEAAIRDATKTSARQALYPFRFMGDGANRPVTLKRLVNDATTTWVVKQGLLNLPQSVYEMDFVGGLVSDKSVSLEKRLAVMEALMERFPIKVNLMNTILLSTADEKMDPLKEVLLTKAGEPGPMPVSLRAVIACAKDRRQSSRAKIHCAKILLRELAIVRKKKTPTDRDRRLAKDLAGAVAALKTESQSDPKLFAVISGATSDESQSLDASRKRLSDLKSAPQYKNAKEVLSAKPGSSETKLFILIASKTDAEIVRELLRLGVGMLNHHRKSKKTAPTSISQLPSKELVFQGNPLVYLPTQGIANPSKNWPVFLAPCEISDGTEASKGILGINRSGVVKLYSRAEIKEALKSINRSREKAGLEPIETRKVRAGISAKYDPSKPAF